MRIFFGGIIQGSHRGKDIFPQDYRKRIRQVLEAKHADIEIIDPFTGHSNSIEYDDQKAHATFFKHLKVISSVDLLLAYLPEASMGTAIELWQAYQNKVPAVTISPLTTNWVIRLFSLKNFTTADDFADYINKNGLDKLLASNARAVKT